MTKWLIAASVIVVGLGLTAAVVRTQTPAPSVGAFGATPTYILVNTPTPVTFTARIAHPNVVPTGVNLLSVDATGKTLTIAGVMLDNGANGDATAGDRVFSLRLTLNRSSVGQVYYRVSAPFKGVLQRVLSQVLPVPVWNKTTHQTTGLSIQYPQSWTIRNPEDEGGLVFSNRPPDPTSNPAALGGLCKIAVGENEKSANLTLLQWRQSVRDETFVSAQDISIDGISGLREIAEEVNRTDTYFFPLSDTRVLVMSMICGSDVRDMGLAIFSQMVTALDF